MNQRATPHVEIPTLPSLLASPNAPYIHRDLSWLQFNDRVLGQAVDETNPLLERAKFLAISASNLDEFFTIRFASLNRSISLAIKERAHKKKVDQLRAIRASILDDVKKLMRRQSAVLAAIQKDLSPFGVQIFHGSESYGEEEVKTARELFDSQILPHLSVPALFKIRDFTTLANLQTAAIFPNNLWLAIPKSIPPAFAAQLGRSANRVGIFFRDDLLLNFLPSAFSSGSAPGTQLDRPGLIRLTRDGDFSVDLEEEDPESIPDVIRTGIGRRDRGRPVRIQTRGKLPPTFISSISGLMKLESDQVFDGAPSTLCLHGLWGATGNLPETFRNHPQLRYPSVTHKLPRALNSPAKLFERLQERDVLLHHPYDPFDAFVSWIDAACGDPKVTAIDLTVYRMDALSPIIASLKKAAKTKQIRVVIELRARFDELNNLRLAEDLRKAGVSVHFGFGKLKVHAKIALVTRQENGALRRYTHLSTGNYNANTARAYTDLAIITANPVIGEDAMRFFSAVCAGKVPLGFKTLVSAPTRLHRRLLAHIEEETRAAALGKSARIVAKVNALVDEAIIDSLYKASQTGVKVDLLVRGACSLIPGVPGLSENIRVLSIVDRYLEHSRIYYFQSSNVMYLSSADWMPRNFFSRLEIAFPVLDPQIFKYLHDVVVPTYLSDTVKARELTPKGAWKVPKGGSNPPIRSQFRFQELADSEYLGTPLE